MVQLFVLRVGGGGGWGIPLEVEVEVVALFRWAIRAACWVYRDGHRMPGCDARWTT